MIRPRISVLVALALSLAACPNSQLVVSHDDNLDGGGGASGAGGAGVGATGGAAVQGTTDVVTNGGATMATALGGASGGDTTAPISTPAGTAGANGGADSITPDTSNTGVGGQVIATAGVTTIMGGANTDTGAGGSLGGSTGGDSGGNGGATVSTGSTGATGKDGPCDIYKAANMPCAAAYSMIRVLSRDYKGPLFQVRAGSSSTNNTMSGGTTKDIMPSPDGFVDSATVDETCGSGYCTVSILYDHSGNENHIKRAQKGSTAGGATGAMDDYESIATKGKVKAGGHTVYSLYMNKLEGYRSMAVGKGMPTGTQPQGTYMLADGTRKGSACCWDFGNVTTKPTTEMAFTDAITLGHTWWGNSKDPAWFGFAIDYGNGVWAGGSKAGDLGWGALDNIGPTNTMNPSMDKAKFALGFIKVSQSEYAIRVADLSIAPGLTEAWRGGLPVSNMNHKGGIVLGVGGDNSNNSYGTFYEGAMVAGYPTNDTELAVMKNITDVGYQAQ